MYRYKDKFYYEVDIGDDVYLVKEEAIGATDGVNRNEFFREVDSEVIEYVQTSGMYEDFVAEHLEGWLYHDKDDLEELIKKGLVIDREDTLKKRKGRDNV